ncbi:hypothetical protein CI238_06205 [Colletotrichum incanum]|uniref:Uncharacterized protein n=1 Tax=Colletotrichum incanum TaxID=1573173 RepID=A0A162NHM2_COLIC|nr:hypothetical protein CI238_06205 [Colletotrichum incanum]
MQLMKSISLLGLVAVQSLAEPIRIPSYLEARDGLNEKRVPASDWVPSPDCLMVEMGQKDSVGRGAAIIDCSLSNVAETDGLDTCIAVVVINRDAQEDDNDRFLAHVSSGSWESQLNGLYEAMDLSNPRVMIIVPNPKDSIAPGAQDQWNKDVIQHVVNQWRGYNPLSYVRDGSRLREDGGSRLWIEGNNVVHWGVTGQVIQPRS